MNKLKDTRIMLFFCFLFVKKTDIETKAEEIHKAKIIYQTKRQVNIAQFRNQPEMLSEVFGTEETVLY